MIDRFADWFAGVLLEKGVITETVTSMTPVPELGVTVTQSGTSVTQSASA